MKIAYYLESDEYRWMADLSVASARRVMPDVPIVHLAPCGVRILDGASELVEAQQKHDAFYARWCGTRHLVEGNVLFADSDTLFQSDVRHVFQDASFDIALPHIASPDVRYDGGVVFSRSPAFWLQLQQSPASKPGATVDQQVHAFNKCVADFSGRKRELPGVVYSYVPKNALDRCAGAAVVHFRGPRKAWMKSYGHR